MSATTRCSITQCTPAWRRHKWRVLKIKEGQPVKVECVHCAQTQTGCNACRLLLSRDGKHTAGDEPVNPPKGDEDDVI